jgi:predicted RNase H-like HicB family nuclease
MARQCDVVIESDSEGYYVASVAQIPACHTQAQFLDEVMLRVREAIELCLEVEGVPGQDLEFVGTSRGPAIRQFTRRRFRDKRANLHVLPREINGFDR